MSKRKNLVLHIGRSKSGTSTLQHYLTQNREQLASQGVCYPKAGCGKRVAQHDIAAACRKLPPLAHELRELRAEFEAEVAPYDRIIVSSEAFQRILPGHNLSLFFGGSELKPAKGILHWAMPWLRTRPYDINVICYIREHLEFASSSYCQNVQNSGNTQTLPEYCGTHFRRSLSSFIRFWQGFADESKFVYYNRKKLRNEDIVEDFFHQIGLTPPSPTIPRDANPSISGNLLAFKLLLNRNKLHYPELYGTFSELARLDPRYRGKIFISDSLAETLRFNARSQNEQLVEIVGEIEKHSFETGNRFDAANWQADLERFLEHPELSKLKDRPEIYGATADDVKAPLLLNEN